MGERLIPDAERSRALSRVKLAATLLLVATATLFGVARFYEATHWVWGYIAAFAAAATVGGLADWYAIVALFRRPLGLPIPHTAIIPRNHQRIADNLGTFVETNSWRPKRERASWGSRLRSQVAEWLATEKQRGAGRLG